jgi:hypothetical protein
MEFVNHLGQPIPALSGGKEAKRQARRQQDVYHKGWLVTGYPREQIEAGRVAHDQLGERLRGQGRAPLPWDLDRFMRDTRPTKIRSKPYETEAAAAAARALAERLGWLGVRVTAVTKGAA